MIITKKILVFFALLFFISALGAGYSEDRQSKTLLLDGIKYFKNGVYNQAILNFRNIILDPELSSEKPDAYFWIAKSYMALKKFKDADRNLEYFILNYPNHPYYSEAIYQKGRLLYLENDYENSIQVLKGFISQFSGSPFVSNAYYWVGEDLYSLGHIDESLKMFKKITESYPNSYKVEAARYKISLVTLKKREQELLKLLRWSHEESLKTIEEFQRRERTYEQALTAYQRKLASFQQAGYQQSIEELKKQLSQKEAAVENLNKSIKEKENSIKTLEDQLKGSEKGKVTITQSKLNALEKEKTQLQNLSKLLSAEKEALKIKETILKWLELNKEKGQ